MVATLPAANMKYRKVIYMAHPQTKLQAFGPAKIGYNNVTQGNCVRNVQLCVIDFVSPTPSISSWVDGYWGPKTMQAVKDFQSSNGLTPVDGLVGNDTKTALWDQYGNYLKSNGYMA